MFGDGNLSRELSSKGGLSETNPKHTNLEKPDRNPHLLVKGGENPTENGASTHQELTLSYLCDNPKLGFGERDVCGKNLLGSFEKLRCKGKEVVLESPVDGDQRWVERDFLQLNGWVSGKGPTSKRELNEEIRGGCEELPEKKAKMETLNLSLGLPNLSLSLNTASPFPITTIQGAATAATADRPSSILAKRSQSNNTHNTRASSDDFAVSLSYYSHSHPFSHNPSCSLTHNSTENHESSRENDHIWYAGAGEGTNGSVHSRFKPIGDTNSNNISFSNYTGYPSLLNGIKETSNSLYRANGSENRSFFPSELPAREKTNNGPATSDGRRKSIVTMPERILWEIVSESVPIVAQILKELPSESVESVKDYLRNLLSMPEKRDELAALQKRIERRSDLTFETLLKSHKTQLDVFVTVKTGLGDYLSGKHHIPTPELAEIFLFSRCRNVNCKSVLPVDDCDCKICSTKKGFCSACMCPICSNFDCAANTCSWVGCDVCSHWCHAVCGIEKNLIRPGPSLRGTMGTTEMHFYCLGCGHASEMFGFVKDVFIFCAKDWGLETLMKELDCVRKIFHGSEDLKGKQLQSKAEEMLTMLEKKLILPSDACNGVLHFLRYGVSELSGSATVSEDITIAQACQKGDDAHSLPPSAAIIPPKSTYNVNTSSTRRSTHRDSLKNELRVPEAEPKVVADLSKKEGFESLESIVVFKEAEAKLFQRLADDARREVEGYQQIVRAKTEKLEEEYATELAKLCLKETEDRRRKKLEELKMLENSHCDYNSMKMRMQAEIAGLLARMEATKQQWV